MHRQERAQDIHKEVCSLMHLMPQASRCYLQDQEHRHTHNLLSSPLITHQDARRCKSHNIQQPLPIHTNTFNNRVFNAIGRCFLSFFLTVEWMTQGLAPPQKPLAMNPSLPFPQVLNSLRAASDNSRHGGKLFLFPPCVSVGRGTFFYSP
jgi:hypothetical protein